MSFHECGGRRGRGQCCVGRLTGGRYPRGMQITVRRARTSDVRAIRRLIDLYSADRVLLSKATVALFEDVQEFWVAQNSQDAAVVACGAVHVMWEDLAEVRTVAVDPVWRRHGVGRQ